MPRTATIIPIRTRTLLDASGVCDEIAMCVKFAGDALIDSHNFNDENAKRQAVKQLQIIADALVKLIAEVEGAGR